jgi:hypothetical protein
MREQGLRGRQRRRFVRTTDSQHAFAVAANVVNQAFDVPAPNRLWAGDITYVPARDGWLYLAVLLDPRSMSTSPSPNKCQVAVAVSMTSADPGGAMGTASISTEAECRWASGGLLEDVSDFASTSPFFNMPEGSPKADDANRRGLVLSTARISRNRTGPLPAASQSGKQCSKKNGKQRILAYRLLERRHGADCVQPRRLNRRDDDDGDVRQNGIVLLKAAEGPPVPFWHDHVQ